MRKLSSAVQRDMRARAHHLNPVVTISNNGLTPAVRAEIERALQAHELIKIRVFGFERDARADLMTQVCEQLDAQPVQHIGKLLVIWKARREETSPEKPATPERRSNPGAKNKSAKAFAAAAQRAALSAQTKRRSPARPGGATSPHPASRKRTTP